MGNFIQLNTDRKVWLQGFKAFFSFFFKINLCRSLYISPQHQNNLNIFLYWPQKAKNCFTATETTERHRNKIISQNRSPLFSFFFCKNPCNSVAKILSVRFCGLNLFNASSFRRGRRSPMQVKSAHTSLQCVLAFRLRQSG